MKTAGGVATDLFLGVATKLPLLLQPVFLRDQMKLSSWNRLCVVLLKDGAGMRCDLFIPSSSSAPPLFFVQYSVIRNFFSPRRHLREYFVIDC